MPAEMPLELSEIPCLLIISPAFLSENLRKIVIATSPKNTIEAIPIIKIAVLLPKMVLLFFVGFIKSQIPSPTKISEPIKVRVILVLFNGISICSSLVIMDFLCSETQHYLVVLVNFLMIKLATNASNKLNGTANINSAVGSTLIFQITIHINTKPTNQERKAV